MALRTNSAEGQANTTVLTAANSGGGSGDAFDSIVKTSTGAITFSTTQKMHGAQGYYISAPAATTAYVVYSGANDASAVAHCYVYMTALPAANGDFLVIMNTSSTTMAKLQILTNGHVNVANAAGGGINNFPTGMVINTWYRLELSATKGTGTGDGTISAAYYVGDATTPVDPVYSSNAVNAGTANAGSIRLGKSTSASATFDGYVDDVAFNPGTTTFIGPNTPPSVALNTTDATAFGSDTTPTLEFTGTDSETNDVQYEVQIDPSNTFGAASATYTSNDTWVAPAGVTSAIVELWGGGGGGGGAGSSLRSGSGAGGGAYSQKTIAVTPSSSYTVVVGAGGTGVAGANGNSGSDSYFIDTSTALAKGGTRGLVGNSSGVAGGPGGGTLLSVGTSKHAGGNGGTVSSDSNSYGSGGGGSAGDAVDGGTGGATTAAVAGTAGAAGTAGGAAGGAGGVAAANGANGVAPGGGGGGGGKGSSPSPAGGNGAAGQVVISYDYLHKNSGSDSGFVNTVTGGDTNPFNSGEKVSFTVQAGDALADGTYYWRARAIDTTGSNTYGAWSSYRSFTVAAGGGGGGSTSGNLLLMGVG